MGLKTITVHTESPQQFIDITHTVRLVVRESGVTRGTCQVFIPHTTAGVTINENTDPDVKQDLLNILETIIPSKSSYLHSEGNAHAHAKASLIGSTITVFIESGQLVLGTWQSIYLCEFDGPRTRNVLFRIISG
ncbi:MAG TPA: secondary thiamine-phosphate synthase enzyme YjbQ [Candidatus Limnocylindria bacterium]|jgi:secondary thiamine-phosphate synthase enzyme|nr:secondary thiamine-phosphate synthase enzyme YjbQ [Candidatus Limnocylindria bacterium]